MKITNLRKIAVNSMVMVFLFSQIGYSYQGVGGTASDSSRVDLEEQTMDWQQPTIEDIDAEDDKGAVDSKNNGDEDPDYWTKERMENAGVLDMGIDVPDDAAIDDSDIADAETGSTAPGSDPTIVDGPGGEEESWMAGMVEKVKDIFIDDQKLTDEQKEELQKLKEEYKQKLKDLKEEYGNNKDELRDEYRQAKDELRDEYRQAKDELRDEYRSEKDRIRDEMRDLKDQLKSAETEEEKETIKQQIKDLKQEKKDLKKQYRQDLKDLKSDYKQDKKDLKNEYKNDQKDLKQQYKEDKQDLKEWYQEEKEKIKNGEEEPTAQELIDKFTDEDGNIDFEGLADALEDMGDAKLLVDVLKALDSIYTIQPADDQKITEDFAYPLLRNAQALINAIDDKDLLKAAREELSPSEAISDEMLVKMIDQRISELDNQAAQDLIDKHTDDDGNIDFEGLADELEELGDAKLFADVLRNLDEELYHIMNEEGTDSDMMIWPQPIPTLTNAQKLIDAVTDVELLKAVKEELSPSDSKRFITGKDAALADMVDKRISQLEPTAQGLIDAYTDENGVLDAQGLADALDNLDADNAAEIVAEVLTLLSPDYAVVWEEDGDGEIQADSDARFMPIYFDQAAAVIKAMENKELLTQVRDILAEKGDRISMKLVDQIDEKLDNQAANELIDKYTDENGNIDFEGLADELEELGDGKLLADVLRNLDSIWAYPLGEISDDDMIIRCPEPVLKNAQQLINAIDDKELLESAKASLQPEEGKYSMYTDKLLADMIDVRISKLDDQAANELIDKYTDDAGNIDFEGLAAELEELGDAGLFADVLRNLDNILIPMLDVEGGREDMIWPMPTPTLGNAQQLIDAVSDVELLKAVKEELTPKEGIYSKYTDAILVKMIDKRISQLEPTAQGLIDAYTDDNGILDVQGLADALDNLDAENAGEIVAEVLTLLSPDEYVLWDQPHEGGAAVEGGDEKMIWYYDQASAVINAMTNKEVLTQARDILAEKDDYKSVKLVKQIDEKLDNQAANELIDKYTDENGNIDFEGLADELEELGDGKLLADVLRNLDSIWAYPLGEISDDDMIIRCPEPVLKNAQQLINAIDDKELLESAKASLQPEEGKYSMYTDKLLADMIDVRISELDNQAATDLIAKYTDDNGNIDFEGLAAELEELGDAGLFADVLRNLDSVLVDYILHDTDNTEDFAWPNLPNAQKLINAIDDIDLLEAVKAELSPDDPDGKINIIDRALAEMVEQRISELDNPTDPITDKYGDVTYFNDQGQKLYTTHTTQDYDDEGNPIEGTKETIVITRYNYDENGRLSSVESKVAVADAEGNLTGDYEWQKSTYSYDAEGNLISITNETTGNVTHFDPEDPDHTWVTSGVNGNVISDTVRDQESGLLTTTYYDELSGAVIGTAAYDEDDNMIACYDMEGNLTMAFFYDEEGRMTHTEAYIRDEKGDIVLMNVTTYDEWGNKIKTVQENFGGGMTPDEKEKVKEIFGEEPASKEITDSGSNGNHSWETTKYFNADGDLIGSRLAVTYMDGNGDERTSVVWTDSNGEIVKIEELQEALDDMKY